MLSLCIDCGNRMDQKDRVWSNESDGPDECGYSVAAHRDQMVGPTVDILDTAIQFAPFGIICLNLPCMSCICCFC